MPSPRAVAYVHDPARVVALGKAFAAGCARHGVACEVRRVWDIRGADPVDAVWLYGLGPARPVFDAYAGRAVRIVGDAGYWRRLLPTKLDQAKRHVRVSIEGPQLGALMNRRHHPPDRFERLRLPVRPVKQRGDYVLVTGRSRYDASVTGMEYGQWERETVERLKRATSRPIMVREKPKNDPICIDGAGRCAHHDVNEAIRRAWAVVCRSGNIGADAILHGVPAFAEFGPGAVYQRGSLEDIDAATSLSPAERIRALSDVAYWQWTGEEIARGELWAHLRDERVI